MVKHSQGFLTEGSKTVPAFSWPHMAEVLTAAVSTDIQLPYCRAPHNNENFIKLFLQIAITG
jgi:hypothetical protein